MKLINRKMRYYHHRSKVQRRHYRLKRIHNLTTIFVFFIMTFGFTVMMQNTSSSNEEIVPEEKKPVVHSIGHPGVTPPKDLGKKLSKKIPKEDVSEVNTAQPSDVVLSKPSWVNMSLYVDPYNSASVYLASNPSVAGIQYIDRMSKTPVAQWFGDWNVNVKKDVNFYVSGAAAKNQAPIVVVYSIPNRDCGGYSVGGASGMTNYISWVKELAAGIGNNTAVVVLEPDALGALDCLPGSLQSERTKALSKAVDILKANPNTYVYIDAGTPVWQPVTVMAQRLNYANIAKADGFSLNVSYFASTSSNWWYGDQLSKLVGNKHYVIDTSRNGGNHNVTGMQCNPSWASFGDTPTTNTENPRNDALLWIKIPWESDGPCNGSPNPGVPYWSYALKLAKNAGWK